jgi:hypothetical protein
VELDALLHEVRQRLGHPHRRSATVEGLPLWHPPEGSPEQSESALLERFIRQAELSGAHVSLLDTGAALEKAVLGVVAARSWQSMTCSSELRSTFEKQCRMREASAAEFGLCSAAAGAQPKGPLAVAGSGRVCGARIDHRAKSRRLAGAT